MLLDQRERGIGIWHRIRRARLLTNLPLNRYRGGPTAKPRCWGTPCG